ncbi:MAG: hypothetical protein ACKOW8_09080, partial [Flavobacteriales bacterium]
MQNRNIPISVWHSQPFELPILDADMRWALIIYRNPSEEPKKISLLRNVFIISRGQTLGAIGNEKCTAIKALQFRWWIAWPKVKSIQLFVRKMAERPLPDVSITSLMPAVSVQVAHELEKTLLHYKKVPRFTTRIESKSKLQLAALHLNLKSIHDEPQIKSFH